MEGNVPSGDDLNQCSYAYYDHLIYRSEVDPTEQSVTTNNGVYAQ